MHGNDLNNSSGWVLISRGENEPPTAQISSWSVLTLDIKIYYIQIFVLPFIFFLLILYLRRILFELTVQVVCLCRQWPDVFTSSGWWRKLIAQESLAGISASYKNFLETSTNAPTNPPTVITIQKLYLKK